MIDGDRPPETDGGPAFPGNELVYSKHESELVPYSGMSLRAYVATHVLAAMYASGRLGSGEPLREWRATEACLDADALIAELEKERP